MITKPYFPVKLTSDIKIHGGKHYLCRRIFESFGIQYRRYCDAFMGGGSMTYNAPQGLAEQQAVERNRDRFFIKYAIRNHNAALVAELKKLEYSKKTFESYKSESALITANIAIDIAVRAIVLARMSRGGLGHDFAWSKRLRGGQPGDLNAWKEMIERLPILGNRLQHVDLIYGNAESAIRRIVSRIQAREMQAYEWLIYLDPPYISGSRASAGEYGDDEMSVTDHASLLRLVLDSVAANVGLKFAISGYRHQMYDSMLGNWRRIDFDMPNHSGQGKAKQRRIECLWMNL